MFVWVDNLAFLLGN